MVVQGQPDLLQVVLALGSSSCFSGGLHGGQEQRHKDPNDRNHHQQLHEGESTQVWPGVDVASP